MLSKIKESNRKHVLDFFESIAGLSVEDKDEIINLIYATHTEVMAVLHMHKAAREGVENDSSGAN